jgi:hypothetical protein
MSNDKIYIATSGEYSDYTILGVFSSEENAKLIHGNDYDVSIEEYELDTFVDLAKKGYKNYQVILNYETGDVESAEVHSWGSNFEYASCWYNLPPKKLNTTTLAKSREGAIKIVNERLAQLKAKEAK